MEPGEELHEVKKQCSTCVWWTGEAGCRSITGKVVYRGCTRMPPSACFDGIGGIVAICPPTPETFVCGEWKAK